MIGNIVGTRAEAPVAEQTHNCSPILSASCYWLFDAEGVCFLLVFCNAGTYNTGVLDDACMPSLCCLKNALVKAAWRMTSDV